MKKYELMTFDKLVVNNVELKRIRALRDIKTQHGTIHRGSTGGYVQSEANLSQDGDCWLHGDVKAYGKARVSGDAQLMGCGEVCQRAQIMGAVVIDQLVKVSGNARISGTQHYKEPFTQTVPQQSTK